MTPGALRFSARPRLLGAALSVMLALGIGVAFAPGVSAAEEPCVGDSCDEGAWSAARGASNEFSYWGMSAGHNCTNYVAWRLSSHDVPRPRTHPGNATDWAANALLDGYQVDDAPTVGSVAQWEGFAGGYGALGHVAYVERVYDDGTILVSEDYWRDGAQIGPLTYRVVDTASVSHFIHYADESTWLRTASATADRWTESGTHLNVVPSAMAALAFADGHAELYYAQDGRLWQATEGASGWTTSDTGIPSDATALSAVSLDGIHPSVISVDLGEIVMTVRTDFGWQRMPTGLQLPGDIAAVDLGGLLPTVFVSLDGALWQAWGDAEGWHAEPTGLGAGEQIAAVVDADGQPTVFSIRNGILARLWLDWSGWRSESMAVSANGRISATQSVTGSEVFVVEDDALFRVHVEGSTWTRMPTGIGGGTHLAVVDLGGSAPLVLQAG